MARFKVGVQLEPQHCSVEDLRAAWRAADAMGVDSIFTWDHFFPLHGDPDGPHFEGWSLLGTMACDTSRASVGLLVGCTSYRSPDLTADMARTLDHVSGGRLILGIGAGWFERDYEEYGFAFGTPGSRLRGLEADILRMRARVARLNPPPRGPLPLLIGGGGERVTLRLTARYADMWNGFGPVDTFVHKNVVLNDWCRTVGRDPAAIERTVLLNPDRDLHIVDAFVEAGAQHLIVPLRVPFDLGHVGRLMAKRDG
ncbi:MAG TPA: LLM class F420-dependent oxidoreductase [Actinomycetota bacterium]|nr:LLM class F420-dependent oxidoreductase [Actinomycetota bacterium]